MTKSKRMTKSNHPERMQITQPRVARNELPWDQVSCLHCPERVASVVAQGSNLLYRSASSLPMPWSMQRNGHSKVLPIGNRRYSRLETCATSKLPDFVNRPCSSGSHRHLFFAISLSFVLLSFPGSLLSFT